MTENDIRSIGFACPSCRSALDAATLSCAACGTVYGRHQGVPCFLGPDARAAIEAAEKSDRENAFKNFFKRWPRFYRFTTRLIIPLVYTGLTSERFLSRYSRDEKLLNVGSGPYLIHPGTVNVDLFPFPNVHVLADASALPFADGTFDAVCSDQVFEHVPNPLAVAKEVLRVTKPGGLIYTAAPFIFPLHPSPKDYSRWSKDGLAELFAGHDSVESGVLIGPTSAFLFVFSMWLATIFSFGITPLRKALWYVFMVPLFPLKVLDFVYARLPGAEDIALSPYLIIQKRV
ncbi:methyltransferase domain-containing protein [Patescibacteria group bacterium]|nr:methyltransferase domain-containing protein [Patescibacteria group bacterium]MBU1448561.1 methyltransferase domain-containing protein [Patescibacteria group bacterium]MBU2613195.1 methyltransferase domain-containing protein [Patescibacteria group bacterium]